MWYLNATPPIKRPRGLLVQGWLLGIESSYYFTLFFTEESFVTILPKPISHLGDGLLIKHTPIDVSFLHISTWSNHGINTNMHCLVYDINSGRQWFLWELYVLNSIFPETQCSFFLGAGAGFLCKTHLDAFSHPTLAGVQACWFSPWSCHGVVQCVFP